MMMGQLAAGNLARYAVPVVAAMAAGVVTQAGRQATRVLLRVEEEREVIC